MSQSQIHDHAMAITAAILEVFSLDDREKATAWEEIYVRVKLGLEHYEMHADRRDKRLRPLAPSKN